MNKSKFRLIINTDKNKIGKNLEIKSFESNYHITNEDLKASIKYLDSNIYKSDKNKIEVIIDNVSYFFGLPIKEGNTKISKNCAMTKLLPIITCSNCGSCQKNCYAKQDLRYYPAYNNYLIYTFLAQNYVKFLEKIYIYQLEKLKSNIVRLHESGDFFSKEYINMIYRIIKKFPKKTFYFYTKYKGNLKKITTLNNVVCVLSYYKNYINFGNKEYINNLYNLIKKDKKYDVSICYCEDENIQQKIKEKYKNDCLLYEKGLLNKKPTLENLKYCHNYCFKCSTPPKKGAKYKIILFLEH